MKASTWCGIVALSWFVHANNYFGWQWRPMSDAELMADFGMYLLIGVFFLALAIERR